jgi:hypothetical protein
MTASSKNRIETFVDWFISSEYVSNWTAEKDSDFWNEPDRAKRCYDAAEFGADGKTHAEVIEDWREAFKTWVRDRIYRNKRTPRYWRDKAEPERFIAAVAKAVRLHKEKHPELFCKHPQCLYQTEVSSGHRECPKHGATK